MQQIKHFAAASALPAFGLMGEDLVFVGTLRDEEGVSFCDVWHVPAEDAIKLQYDEREHECSCFPLAIARIIAENDPNSVYRRAVELYDEVRAVSTRVAQEAYLGNVTIHVFPGTKVDESGESQYEMIMLTHDDVPADLLDLMVRERFPATHCTHEYDCCGHFYGGYATRTFYRDDHAIYRRDFHLNI